MDIVASFNAAEAILWFTFEALTLAYAKSVRGMTPRLKTAFVIAFIASAFSDIIETTTGAWWRPPELLALKAAALSVIIITGRLIRRARTITNPPRP
jgi:hypothetical protein